MHGGVVRPILPADARDRGRVKVMSGPHNESIGRLSHACSETVGPHECPACADHYARANADSAKLRAVVDAAATLVATLPKCDRCDAPATRAWTRGTDRFCDACGPDVCEYPRATALRATIAALNALEAR